MTLGKDFPFFQFTDLLRVFGDGNTRHKAEKNVGKVSHAWREGWKNVNLCRVIFFFLSSFC
jgi:hypothetical protein